MKERLPIVLSATALLVALFGSTPLGGAANRLIHAAPPFAKKASYAKTAGFAKLAENAKMVDGIKAAKSPHAGLLVPLGADGKFPASVGAVGPQGPVGAVGPRGPAGPVDTSKLLGRTVTFIYSHGPVAPGGFGTQSAFCPSVGYEAVGGGVGPENTFTMVVTKSEPDSIDGTDVSGLPDGMHGSATGWLGSVRNNDAVSHPFKVVVVCAKIGT